MGGDSPYSRDPAEAGGSGSLVLWAVRQVVLWGGLTALVYGSIAVYRYQHPGQPVGATASASTPRVVEHTTPVAPSALSDVPNDTLVYRAASNGHVFLDADVNGTRIHFIVDTGATYVVLSLKDAATAGFAPYQLSFTGRSQTANGVARFAHVKLREVRLGQLAIDDVDAGVVENLGTSLLGQSFLKRLRSYEMRDGKLTITW